MSFQLSPELTPELKSTMSELGYDWIRIHYTELHSELEMKCDEDDEDNEADTLRNDHLKSILFYQLDKRSFGKYLKESGRINAEDTIQLMRYCEEYYCNSCNTVQGLLDFTRIHDLEYVGTQFGYIYADVEINVLEEFNSIKNGPLLK